MKYSLLFLCFLLIGVSCASGAHAEGTKTFESLQSYKVAAFVATFPAINQFNERLIDEGIEPLFSIPRDVAPLHELGESAHVLKKRALELKASYPHHYEALKNALSDLDYAQANPVQEIYNFGTPEEWGAYGDRVYVAFAALSQRKGNAEVASLNQKHNDAKAKALEQFAASGVDFSATGLDIKAILEQGVEGSRKNTTDIVKSYTFVSDHDKEVVKPFNHQLLMQISKYN